MPCSAATGLNIVVLLLDDMRADQLDVLARSNALLAEHAVVFDRAYVTIPLCCPERASFLSGGFLPQGVGVLTNKAPLGGATVFPDDDTLATRLQGAGYATALFGKYLNEYEDITPYVPPGWTQWAAFTDEDLWFSFPVRTGTSTPDAPGAASDMVVDRYVTHWQSDLAKAFLAEQAGVPRFVYVSFAAPHDPHEPAPEDVGAYDGYTFRGGAWQEADVSDKPAWIQALPLLSEAEIAALDVANAERMESLLAVDRGIESILRTLADLGDADDTVVVITSDNGLAWGEHRMQDKGVAYEPVVRVPLVVWNPRFSPRHTDALVAANLDLAATVTDLAALPARGDGRSLRPVLCGDTEHHRDAVVLQDWSRAEAWSGLVTPEWKYIETGTDTRELYDLAADPAEERSIAAERPEVVETLAAMLAEMRGLRIVTRDMPDGTVGRPYAAPVAWWGGVAPYDWTVGQDALPDGLVLGDDGWIRGTPAVAGTFTMPVSVRDGSVSGLHGGPQHDARDITLVVATPDAPPAPTHDVRSDVGCGCGEGGTAGAALVVLPWLTFRRRRRPNAPERSD